MDSAFLLTLLLPVAVSHVLDLPNSVLFKVGERTELTCSMLSCPEKVMFVWLSLEDRPTFATVTTHERKSVLVFDKVEKKHENTILCKASCGTESKQKTTSIRVYSFPTNPVISKHDLLILGEENVLSCEVSPVYPSEYLKVQWIYGDEVVSNEEGEFGKDSFTSQYKLTPSNEDDGKAITCRASLDLDDIPESEKTKETSRNMNVLSAPHHVKVSGETTVSLGSNLTLTCEAEGKPEPVFTWTTLKPDGQSVEMGKLRELFIPNVSLSNAGTYQCEVSNDLGRQNITVSVVVQAPPMNTLIEASPQSSLKEGDSVTISCESSGVPVTHVVLSRIVDGVETELTKHEGAETTLLLYPVKLSDSAIFVCEAFNEYGKQKRTLSLTVEAHLLEVELQPYESIVSERGSSLVFTCQASGCPQPEFSWKTLSHMPIHRGKKTDKFQSQLFLDPVEPEDEETYICEVTCGSVQKSKETEVKVFSFPTTPVIKSPGPCLVGEMMNLTCTVQEVFPNNHFQILWMDGEQNILREDSGSFSNGTTDLTSVYSFKVDTKDQGKQITCKVVLDMDGVPKVQAVKMVSTNLSIHYPPKSTRITVTPQTELKEGESVSISCSSDSFPVAHTVLSRMENGVLTELITGNGTETLFTIPSVELDDSGIYVCEAVNMYGSHSDTVEITVKAPPRNTTVEIFPSTDVQEGQNITICCRSVSFPPPAVVLSKLDTETNIYSVDGVFLLINLTPNDTGVYRVNVTNDLGYETEIFNITVKEKVVDSTLSWNDFLFPAFCLGVASTVLGFVVYVWRAERKKGSYDLTKCTV